MSTSDLAWTVPVMRAGYAGRGLVYIVVACFSLYAIWRGGEAKGTSSALEQLEHTVGGGLILVMIFLGMLAFALWRFVDSAYDLEEFGSGAKGLVARTNLFVTGLTHLAIGGVAFSVLFLAGGDGDGSAIAEAVRTVFRYPGGRIAVGLVGLVVIGAGGNHFHKGWTGRYREHLRANHVTARWNWILQAGVVAKGVIVFVIGLLLVYAAIVANPEEAGGADKALSWLTQQPYGRGLVALVCVGLLGYASYCFVNAAYRIVPRVDGHDIETLAAYLRARLREAF